MIKTWLKIIKNNKIIFSHDMENYENTSINEKIIKCLYDSCTVNNFGIPVLLKKHKKEISNHHSTIFYKDDFMEDIEFDKMEFDIIKIENEEF